MKGEDMAYTREYGIMSDGYTYDGERRHDEAVCTVTWLLDDVLDMMASKDIELTDENIDAVLGGSFARVLQDRSIEEGWEIIDVLVDEAMWEKERG